MTFRGCVSTLATALLVVGCNPSTSNDKTAPPPAPAAAAKPAPVTSAGSEKAAKGGPEKLVTKRRVFVSNYKNDTLSIAEGEPVMETRTIPAGASPHGLAIRMSKPRLLAVANSTAFGVTFFDPDTLEKKGQVETSRGPEDLVFSKDEKLLYVVSPMSFDLQVIDVAKMETVGEPTKFDDAKPRRLVINDDGTKLFVLMVGVDEKGAGSHVAVLDRLTRTTVKRIPIGKFPHSIALGNNGRTLATTSFDDSTITVIDAASLEVLGTYEALTGMGLAIHPTKPIAYSTESFDDTIQILDLTTGAEITTLTAGQWPTYPSFGPDGRLLYIPHEESDSVVVLDTETNTVVGKISVGSEPIEVAIYEP